jgi:hypothetical protein
MRERGAEIADAHHEFRAPNLSEVVESIAKPTDNQVDRLWRRLGAPPRTRNYEMECLAGIVVATFIIDRVA